MAMRTASGYHAVGAEVRRRLAEPAPGRVQLLSGPRQTGKTTLLLEIAREWGERALYLPADAPEAAVPGRWELQWQRAARMAREGTALVLLDEVHYLPDWARLLKAEVDRVSREGLPIHVVATGSAALGITQGAVSRSMLLDYYLVVVTVCQVECADNQWP
jgi:predicted AAA+ superfamily ATPase